MGVIPIEPLSNITPFQPSPIKGEGVGEIPSPSRRGRVRVGVISTEPLHYHPHPSLPPSRGKECLTFPNAACLVRNIQVSRHCVVFEHVRLPVQHMAAVRENLLGVVDEYR